MSKKHKSVGQKLNVMDALKALENLKQTTVPKYDSSPTTSENLQGRYFSVQISLVPFTINNKLKFS